MTVTGTQVLVGGFTLACAVAAATWQVRSDRLEDLQVQIQALKEANGMDYSELLTRISEAASALDKNLSKLESVQSLEESNKLLRDKVKNLESRLQSVGAELETKAALLEEVNVGDVRFLLRRGEARELAGGTAVVGFTGSTIDLKCMVTVNNVAHVLESGGYIEILSRERKCKIILTQCRYGSSYPAEIRFLCEGGKSGG